MESASLPVNGGASAPGVPSTGAAGRGSATDFGRMPQPPRSPPPPAPPAEEDTPAPPPRPTWTWPKAFLFRFAAIYFLLYSFPFPLNAIPFGLIGHERLPDAWVEQVRKAGAWLDTEVAARWNRWEDTSVRWVGEHVLRADVTVGPAGSGDTTWNYAQLFTFAAAALLVAIGWSLFARRRAHPRLYPWFRAHLRFVLSLAMLSYGAFKVIPSQMPLPDLERLTQPFGEASPMGLLWTFIGASPAFERLSGLAEIVGGVLLVPRRTTTLGALFSAGVMANVFAFNVFYDTPVKLYSGHLLLMALLVALPDAPQLARLLALRGAAAPLRFDRLFAWGGLHWPAWGLKWVVVGWSLWTSLEVSRRQHDAMTGAGLAANSPLRGIWNVTYFELDGEERSPFDGEPAVWRRLIVGYPGRCVLDTVGDNYERWGMQVDPAAKSVALTHFGEAGRFGKLAWTRQGPDDLALDGTFDGRAIRVEMKLEPPRSWLLLDRGFHWINEFPYNR